MEIPRTDLSTELLHRKDADQAMRIIARENEDAWDSSVDQDNEKRLREIVDEIGWPTISLVGSDASNAAWLIIQHASDIEFMESCLGLMKSCTEGEIKLANVAYLEDRVRMYKGESQLYGTQWKGPVGRAVLYALVNPESVDERRATMGLGTLAEDRIALEAFFKR